MPPVLRAPILPQQRAAVAQPAFWGAGLGGMLLGGAAALGSYMLREAAPNRGLVAAAAGVAGLAVGGLIGHVLTRPPTFANRQPQDLTSDMRGYMAEWRRTRNLSWDQRAYVVSYQANPVEFRRRVRSRQKFLWTLDTQGFLSVGSPTANKHSVVGAGRTVYAAGTGQLCMPQDVQNYLGFEYLARQAFRGIQQGHRTPDNNPYIEMARDAARNDNIRAVPNMGALPDIVELDFDSGHYQPRNAWTETNRAWVAAGFQVRRNPQGRHI
ncbi:MAG: hypothetical protein KJ904_10930 [Alphaproteobacteria bacterium]|nr:hypothetical protein [Alphaproteobacteria bacterium]MBU0795614.1 hypothetical protein [Alphaproteobacteria bacterium]MBU0887671.1 hypothetical protein [Alphaproteobacteria bacterium]MBU1812902.1 hypothetical protein [Alphaproteobacteria bacterium]